jgi:cytochrome c oxidase subunit 3
MSELGVLRMPYAKLNQQAEARRLGMWLFLASEVMLFGGLFMTILVYRVLYPEAARTASHQLYFWIASGNTAIILTSSLFVAVANLALRERQRRAASNCLLIAIALGAIFLGLKAFEYTFDILAGLLPGAGPPSPLGRGPAQLFIDIYFVATGLHALHLTVGIGLLAWTGLLCRRRSTAVSGAILGATGLYWHVVDVFWLFLYPALYMVGSRA